MTLFLLVLTYLGSVSAKVETSTIEKDIYIEEIDTTYHCTFNIQHDDEESVLDTESSSVECSPTTTLPFRVNDIELEDDEGHIFMVDIQMSPDRILQAEYEGLTPQEEFTAQGVVEIEDGKEYECAAHDPRLDEEEDRGAHWASMPSWPRGIVPYVFDYGFDRQDRLTFAKAVQQIEAKTCVRFRPRTSEAKWLKVIRQCHCRTPAGRNCFKGGTGTLGAHSPSKLTIGACLSPDSAGAVKLVAHEILHNLGIGHTQTRPDRDNYIWIYKNNIQPSGWFNYKKCTKCKTHGTPYDCSSIMHYRDWAFSVNRRPTMVAKNKATCDVSKTIYYLSNADVKMINAIYQCGGGGGGGGPKPVHGKWGYWSAWSTCRSQSQYRYRLCNNPKPANGGRRCTGEDKETRSCSTTTGGDECPLVDTNTKGRRNRRVSDGVESWQACANICAEIQGCTYWTWHHEKAAKPYALRCVIMDGYSSTVRDTNAISGSVSCAETTEEEPCPEKDVNTRGRGHSSKIVTDTWQECANVCKEIPFCTYWTWHHKGAGYYYRRCIIMAGFANKVTDTNAISGSKKCKT